MAQPLPIKFQELLTLNNVGVDSSAIGFNSCVGCTVYPILSSPALGLN